MSHWKPIVLMITYPVAVTSNVLTNAICCMIKTQFFLQLAIMLLVGVVERQRILRLYLLRCLVWRQAKLRIFWIWSEFALGCSLSNFVNFNIGNTAERKVAHDIRISPSYVVFFPIILCDGTAHFISASVHYHFEIVDVFPERTRSLVTIDGWIVKNVLEMNTHGKGAGSGSAFLRFTTCSKVIILRSSYIFVIALSIAAHAVVEPPLCNERLRNCPACG